MQRFQRGETSSGVSTCSHNSIFTPSGSIVACNLSLADFQRQGFDPGTTAAPLPAASEVVGWAAGLLGLGGA